MVIQTKQCSFVATNLKTVKLDGTHDWETNVVLTLSTSATTSVPDTIKKMTLFFKNGDH